ncbi:YbaL family putative K(+) efflux transporter [Nannocystis radixulma]|uniref:YbaL family putative K(+) efflux transporter n=1 Tax=Nannocystis radixulma TaxID=2995305 RepID=A0ABT5B8V0_9BACT|nr:YbaL family putative K(+) efflux transporter [Nannocystis radixulma]
MEHETTLVAMMAAGFGLAFLLGLAARRVRVPPLVGYLLAGIVVGPYTPGFVGDAEVANQFAEIGVILLMFGVGLHFSPRELLAVRKISLPGAVVQIVAATAMGVGLSLAWGWSWGAGLVFGLALSVASTVVLLRALEERELLSSADGRIAVGWLIVEDLAMVLALVLLPALSRPLGGASGDQDEVGLLVALVATFAKLLAFLVFMFFVGRRAAPWLLIHVARTGSHELFTLGVLALSIGIAVGAAALFGVSFALGAFFAGVVISESRISHQAAADALPMQDAFAVLFFVSVGMLFDPAIVIERPLQVLYVVLIVMLGKSFAALGIVLAFRYPIRTALIVAASLAQIGEFSFILARLGVELQLLPLAGHQLLLAGALLTITLNPLVFAAIGPIERALRKRPRLMRWLERPAGPLAELPPAVEPQALDSHVVLIGYGKVGEPIARELARLGLPYVVVEQNREAVEELRARGVPAIYGDATRAEILVHAHIERARLLMVATSDPLQARLMVEHALRQNQRIDMVVRTHSDAERDYLERQGVARVVVAEREVALGFIRYALNCFGIPEHLAEAAAETLQVDRNKPSSPAA